MKQEPKARFDGGALDCGGGLLLLIRRHIDPLLPGEILEFTSTESSVEVDLPAWCNLTGNRLLSCEKKGGQFTFLLEKAQSDFSGKRGQEVGSAETFFPAPKQSSTPTRTSLPLSAGSVMGIGSWPRPRWMLRAIHEHLSQRMSDEEFEETAQDAVQSAVEAQERAGVDVVSDGEQRRDSYASFIGRGIENCQLIPLLDVLAYVDDPEEFRRELQALDIPAGEVRHPMVFGPLRRSRSLLVNEVRTLHHFSKRPSKIAIPGPYLLTRMMWMDCVVDRAYATREALAADVVGILREEIQDLLHEGVSLVQIDEPILTEVVFGHSVKRRSFMCGILGEKKSPQLELDFARELIRAVTFGFRKSQLAVHMCRGNWSPDESHAIRGGYEPLVETLNGLEVGTLFLEMATERAGSLTVLQKIREDVRLGIGVANQKRPQETQELITQRVRTATELFGLDRLFFTPDCGFATFADNPIDSAEQAEGILKRIVTAVKSL